MTLQKFGEKNIQDCLWLKSGEPPQTPPSNLGKNYGISYLEVQDT